jgi:hypothetical protein
VPPLMTLGCVIKQTLPWLGLLSMLAAACALETALISLPPDEAPSTPAVACDTRALGRQSRKSPTVLHCFDTGRG